MDTKINIKEEESLSDDIASQNGTEFFHEVVTMKRENDDELLDDHCDMTIKAEIKSETPYPKHPIKTEMVICSTWEIDRKTVIEEQTLVSDFGPQKEGEFLSEDPVMDKEYNCDHETGKKLERTEELCWLDDIKDEDFSAVKSSRLYTEAVSGAVSDRSPLIPAEVLGEGTSFYTGKDYLECEHQKSDDSEITTAEEYVLPEQSGKCNDDQEKYIRHLYLKQKALIHQDKRSHKCKTCDKSFTCLSHLKIHNLIHEGKKPHQCSVCGRSFTQLSHLKTHSLIHEGKKPHKCKVCDKSFTILSNLKTHNLIHEGKKPHKCKVCGKSFTHLSNLRTHNLIHEGKKGYQCTICDKSFTHLSHLKDHHLIHEGKKPHQCKVCGKSFTRLSHLKTHCLIHEGKKPHQCKVCDKNFTQLSHLKSHKLIHEGKKAYQRKV